MNPNDWWHIWAHIGTAFVLIILGIAIILLSVRLGALT